MKNYKIDNTQLEYIQLFECPFLNSFAAKAAQMARQDERLSAFADANSLRLLKKYDTAPEIFNALVRYFPSLFPTYFPATYLGIKTDHLGNFLSPDQIAEQNAFYAVAMGLPVHNDLYYSEIEKRGLQSLFSVPMTNVYILTPVLNITDQTSQGKKDYLYRLIQKSLQSKLNRWTDRISLINQWAKSPTRWGSGFKIEENHYLFDGRIQTLKEQIARFLPESSQKN